MKNNEIPTYLVSDLGSGYRVSEDKRPIPVVIFKYESVNLSEQKITYGVADK